MYIYVNKIKIMKKQIQVLTVQFSVFYNNKPYTYTEHFNERGKFMRFTITDWNDCIFEEGDEVFDEIMNYLEGTFFELYRKAMY
jgi:hypothetical protein